MTVQRIKIPQAINKTNKNIVDIWSEYKEQFLIPLRIKKLI